MLVESQVHFLASISESDNEEITPFVIQFTKAKSIGALSKFFQWAPIIY
jgi:hypothetical protein